MYDLIIYNSFQYFELLKPRKVYNDFMNCY